MVHRSKQATAWHCLLVLAGLVVLGTPPALPAAEATGSLPASLKLVPADTAVYGAMLRNREQIEAMGKTQAWAELWSLPAVQTAWKQVEKEYKTGQLAMLRQIVSQPENAELLAVLTDAVSQEIFTVGGANWGDFVDMMAELNTVFQFSPLNQVLQGNLPDPQSMNKQRLVDMLVAMGQMEKLVLVPDTLIGFKVSDTKKAEAQLTRLKDILDNLSKQLPPNLAQRLQQTKVGNSSFLTLTLDGKLIPWDKIPFKEIEDKPGQFKALIAKLTKSKLTIGLGIKDGYLLLSLGATLDPITKFGGAGDKLVSRPELKPLVKLAGKPLNAISYISKALVNRGASEADNVDALVEMAKLGLDKLDLDKAQQKRILKDLEELSRDMKKKTPEGGARLEVSFSTEQGEEGYSYDYGKHPNRDGSKPLTLLNHVGGSPILAVVGRGRYAPENYQAVSKFVRVVYGHLDSIALAKLGELGGDQKEIYQKVSKALVPLFKQFDQITGTLFLPSMADGQKAFVLDAKWSSKQWTQFLPETKMALPLPEVGIVIGLSDAGQLVKAMNEYRKLFNETVATLRKVLPDGDNIPEQIQIPEPQSVEKEGNKLYFYPIPELAGLDAKVQPTAGVGKSVAVLTLSEAHAVRLLSSRGPRITSGPLADTSRPLAGAVIFDWAGLVEALSPWIDFATQEIIKQHLGEDAPKKAVADITRQVKTVVAVLKCFKGVTAATYFEGDVLVTHTLAVTRDLGK